MSAKSGQNECFVHILEGVTIRIFNDCAKELVFLTLNSFTDHSEVVVQVVFALGESELGDFVDLHVWD